MKLSVTGDLDAESGVDEVIYELASPTDSHFRERDYGSDLDGIAVVLMCRDPKVEFKRRIRLANKEKMLYLDIMLDLEQMSAAGHERRVEIVVAELRKEIPAVLARYSLEDFDVARFLQDLNTWLDRLMALRELSRLLSQKLGEAVIVKKIMDLDKNSEKGANHERHKKAVLSDRRVIGLKAAERVSNGTRREYLLAEVATKIGAPGGAKPGLLTMPGGLPLEGKDVVALQWIPNAKPIHKLTNASEARQSTTTAHQLGVWLWLCLTFKVEDRKPANWVWSESERTVAMIDCEDWRPSMSPERLAGVVKVILGCAPTEEHQSAMASGMREAKERLSTARRELQALFKQHGEPFDDSFSSEDPTRIAAKICGRN